MSAIVSALALALLAVPPQDTARRIQRTLPSGVLRPEVLTALDTTRIAGSTQVLDTSRADTTPQVRVDLSRFLLGERNSRLTVSGRTGTEPLADDTGGVRQVVLGREDILVMERPALQVTPGVVGEAVASPGADEASEVVSGPSGDRMILPVRYIAIDRESNMPLYLRPVVETLGRGLQLGEDAGGVFTGRIRIGLEDTINPAESRTLARPIQFQIGGDVDGAEPGTLTLDHTNLPFSDVTLSVRVQNLPDSVRLQVRSSLGTRPHQLALGVLRPRLAVEGPVELLGFGLETGTFTVRAPHAGEGRVWRVNVSALPRGRPEPSLLSVPSGELASFSVRSTGLGTVALRATAAPLEDGLIEVRYTFPLAFLLFATLGGALGGAIGAVRLRRQGEEAAYPPHALTGVAVGLLVAVAYAVGLNLIGLEFTAQSGEALVFTLAALGAAVGPPILEKLAK